MPLPGHRNANGKGHVKVTQLRTGEQRYAGWLTGEYLGTFGSHAEAERAIEKARIKKGEAYDRARKA